MKEQCRWHLVRKLETPNHTKIELLCIVFKALIGKLTSRAQINLPKV